jgi:predicted ATPase/class 3 adenylate cyclase
MITCLKCQYQNPDDADICLNCASLLSYPCPACGKTVIAGSLFCATCGMRLPENGVGTAPENGRNSLMQQLRDMMPASLSAKISAASAHVSGERREVTVLTLDATRFTESLQGLGSEEIYLLINEAMRSLVNVIYDYEGTLDKFTGDSLTALFGAPVAHENDPERAVRAALDMQNELHPLRERVKAQHGADLPVRVGINTGLVIAGAVGNDLRMEYTVIGDTIELARRLAAGAAPGAVLTSFSTYQRTHPLFDYDALTPLDVDSTPEPIPAYRLIGLRLQAGSVRGLPGLHAPMIGRDSALALLQQGLAHVQDQQRRQIVLVSGEAGLGKSRLVSEFLRSIAAPSAQVFQGSCMAYARSKPWWVVAELLRSILRIREATTAEEQLHMLQNHMAQRHINAEEILPYLCHTLGLIQNNPRAEVRLRLMDAQMLQRQGAAAVRQVLVAEAQLATTLFILEDMHWADQASLEFLENLIQSTSDVPYMMVLVSRDQDSRTTLRPLITMAAHDPASFVNIELQHLTEKESTFLADQLLGRVSEETRSVEAHIVKRAEGLPFYIEELLRILIDRGGLINDGQLWQVTSKADDLLREVPGTLRGLILARYDRLAPELRRVLQIASVISRPFPASLMVALERTDGEATQGRLTELVQRRFLKSEPFGAERGYVFHHALIQEAIYGTLLKRDRQKIHDQVAQAIERTSIWMAEDKAEVLAYHYAESPAPLRAIPHLLTAADNASRRYSNETAIQYYQQAIMLMQQTAGHEAQLARTQLSLGVALKFTGEYDRAADVLLEVTRNLRWMKEPSPKPEMMALLVDGLRELADVRQREGALDDAIDYLEKALDTLGPVGTLTHQGLWRPVMERLAWVRFRQGRLDEAFAVACSATFGSDTAQADDPITSASLYNTLGGIFWQQGKLAEASSYVERGLQLYRRLGYTFGMANAYTNLGVLYYAQGMWKRAAEDFAHSTQLRREIGYMPGQALNLYNLGLLHMAMGNLEQARRDLEASLSLSRRLGEELDTVQAAIGLAQLDFIGARFEATAAQLDQVLSVTGAAGDDEEIQALCLLALVQAEKGELKQGMETVTRALAKARTAGLTQSEADCLRASGTLHRRMGKYGEAEGLLQQSISLHRLQRDVYRESQSLLELAQLYCEWATDGQNERDFLGKAVVAVSEAVRVFRDLGATHDLKMAEELLARVRVHAGSRAATGELAVDAAGTMQPEPTLRTSSSPATQGEWSSAAIVWLNMTLPSGADDEAVFETLSHTLPHLVAIAHDYQGEVIRRQTGLTVVLGAPLAHENDAERAVWVATRMLQVLKQPTQPDDLALTAQVAVSMGEIVAGRMDNTDAPDLVVMGPPMQMAQYVAEHATPGKVWVTQPVRAATERVFVYGAPSDPNGQALVHLSVSEMVGLHDRPAAPRGILTRKAQLVGREDAIWTMLSLARNLSQNVGGVIWIDGEAGIGKSRLMQEFAVRMQPYAQVWFGQCSPQRSGQAFFLATNLIANTLGLRPEETTEQVIKHIDEAMARWPAEAMSSRPFIDLLMGVSSNTADSERLDNLSPDQLRQQIFVALRNLLKGLSGARPIVLLLDDLHWIDPMSADLILFLSNMVASLPILFVCTQRWEEKEKPNNSLTRMQNLHTAHTLKIFLDRLTVAQSEALLSDLLPEAAVSPELRTFILERGEGNPYYIEELIRMLIEQEYLRRTAHEWVIDERVTVGDLSLPRSLGALMRSRVDTLPSELKHLLQYAAVIGSPAEGHLLLTVAGVPEGDELLARLQARGMLRPSGNDQQWQFSHTLLETAVYNSMLRTHRQELHLHVAGALESRWAGEEDAHADELAYHYSQANQPARALKYLVIAGERASARNANEEALTYFKEASEITESLVETSADLAWRVVAGLGDTYRRVGEYAASMKTLEAGLTMMSRWELSHLLRAGLYRRLGVTAQKQGALEKTMEYFHSALAELGNPTRPDELTEAARIMGDIAWTHFVQGRLDQAAEACASSISYAQRSGGLTELAAAVSVLSGVFYQQGKWSAAFYHTTRSMSLREQMGYTWGVAQNKSNLGILAASAGEWKLAEDFFEQSLHLRQNLGDVEGVAIVHNNLASLARDQGNLDRAEQHFNSSLELSEPLKMAYHITNSQLGLAQVLLLRGDPKKANRKLDECLVDANDLGANDLLTEIRLTRAEICLASGELGEAHDLAGEAIHMAAAVGNRRLEAAGWRLESQLELSRGDAAAARQAIEMAHQAMSEVTDELERGRIATQKGRLLLYEGHAEEAIRELQAAKVIFTHLGAMLDLAAVHRIEYRSTVQV